MAAMKGFESTRQVAERATGDKDVALSVADFWRGTTTDLTEVAAAAMVHRGVDIKTARRLATDLAAEVESLERRLRAAAETCTTIATLVKNIETEATSAATEKPRMEVN